MKITDSQRIDRLYQKIARLTERVNNLDEWSNGADEILTELNHSLPDPEYDAKCEENAVAVEESLARHAVRLGLAKPELTGSDLCRKMFKRGDNYVMCVTGKLRNLVIIDTLEDGKFYSFGTMYENPIPINNQGEPLTAADVGL